MLQNMNKNMNKNQNQKVNQNQKIIQRKNPPTSLMTVKRQLPRRRSTINKYIMKLLNYWILMRSKDFTVLLQYRYLKKKIDL